MPKSSQNKLKRTRKEAAVKKIQPNSSIWDIFKFGESYTSLILGIVVVIIATITLLSFVKGRNETAKLSQVNQQPVAQQINKNKEIKPARQNTQDITVTKIVTPTKTEVTKIAVKPTNTVTAKIGNNSAAKSQIISGTTYIVAKGDSLWNIAEKKYKSGYNWVDIQKANNIGNPDLLIVGRKLTLPSVKAKISTNEQIKSSNTIVTSPSTSKISGNNYTVVKGDTLWDIAIRAYGDGYAWTKIARTNKLSNPDLIYPGNKLIIPRG